LFRAQNFGRLTHVCSGAVPSPALMRPQERTRSRAMHGNWSVSTGARRVRDGISRGRKSGRSNAFGEHAKSLRWDSLMWHGGCKYPRGPSTTRPSVYFDPFSSGAPLRMNSLERASQLTGINPSVRVARLEPPDSEWRGTSIGSLHSASHPFGFAQGRSAFDREDRGVDRRDRRHRRDRA
jgi:hypothetical protein